MVLVTKQAARYRVSLTDIELGVYLDDLAGFSEATLTAAFARCAESNPRFFPTVAEIRAAAVQCLDASDRDRLERLRYWRGLLPLGICPHHWTPAALRRASAILGLPAPSSAALARCEENNRQHSERVAALPDAERDTYAALPCALDADLAAMGRPQRGLTVTA